MIPTVFLNSGTDPFAYWITGSGTAAPSRWASCSGLE